MKNRLESLDNLGSPAVVTDESINVKKQYRYYAFGDVRASSGSFGTDSSFTGYLKEETGAHYAKMRYYEGGIGRFLRPDPLGALNPYAYCGNDPLNFVDPEGTTHQRQEEPEERQWEGFNWLEYQDACYDYLDAGGTPYVWNKSPEETYREMTREWIEWNQFSGTDLAGIFGIFGKILWTNAGLQLPLAILGIIGTGFDFGGFLDGALVFKGGLTGGVLDLFNAGAITFGNFVFATNYEYSSKGFWKSTMREEIGHVNQYGVLGPAFIPTYLYYHLKYGYSDNPLEKEAKGKSD